MAIDKFGLPYGKVDMPAFNFTGNAPPDTAMPAFSNQESGNIAGAGIGAASSAASAILQAIAAQNKLDVEHQQAALERQNTGSMNDVSRAEEGREAAMKFSRGAENQQLYANKTGTDAILGGQGIKDQAISSIADRIAKLYSR